MEITRTPKAMSAKVSRDSEFLHKFSNLVVDNNLRIQPPVRDSYTAMNSEYLTTMRRAFEDELEKIADGGLDIAGMKKYDKPGGNPSRPSASTKTPTVKPTSATTTTTRETTEGPHKDRTVRSASYWGGVPKVTTYPSSTSTGPSDAQYWTEGMPFSALGFKGADKKINIPQVFDRAKKAGIPIAGDYDWSQGPATKKYWTAEKDAQLQKDWQLIASSTGTGGKYADQVRSIWGLPARKEGDTGTGAGPQLSQNVISKGIRASEDAWLANAAARATAWAGSKVAPTATAAARSAVPSAVSGGSRWVQRLGFHPAAIIMGLLDHTGHFSRMDRYINKRLENERRYGTTQPNL